VICGDGANLLHQNGSGRAYVCAFADGGNDDNKTYHYYLVTDEVQGYDIAALSRALSPKPARRRSGSVGNIEGWASLAAAALLVWRDATFFSSADQAK
jgi:hypothetical protein